MNRRMVLFLINIMVFMLVKVVLLIFLIIGGGNILFYIILIILILEILMWIQQLNLMFMLVHIM